MTYDEIEVGQVYEKKVSATAKDVETFAEITGDKNPLHLDDEFAKNTIFGGRIVHGILGLGKISTILGMEFPGPGTIYMSQNSKFLAPIYLDEEVTIKITVKEKIEEKKRLILNTQILKENGKVAIDGEAMVKYDK
jgi:3-hydroxybutyryl-CoA dehydratase